MLGLRISPLLSTGQLMFILRSGTVFSADSRTTGVSPALRPSDIPRALILVVFYSYPLYSIFYGAEFNDQLEKHSVNYFLTNIKHGTS
ncbi:MAG: hypothetical protein ACI8TE_000086 [Francisella sp.]|jgi:hypothetical protein